jgi:hypothetical protein
MSTRLHRCIIIGLLSLGYGEFWKFFIRQNFEKYAAKPR